MNEYSFLTVNNEIFSDFYLVNCGIQECKPSYSFGPAMRDHYIIHYVISGKGYYYYNNKKYVIEKNQGFLILPDTLTFYHADMNDPWKYIWIGLRGDKAEFYLDYVGLSADKPLFMSNKGNELLSIVTGMLSHNNYDCANNLYLQGMLIMFFSCIAESKKTYYNIYNDNNAYISKAIKYIEDNYQNKITVADIAKHVSLNRTYLTAIFKNNLNLSPQSFIQKYKITKSCELLGKTSLSIAEISSSCGYSDPLSFSKAFKKITKMTPSDYRKAKLKPYQVSRVDPYDQLKI